MLRLELIDISKHYAAVKANDRIRLRVEPGEIHAVLGENGAGKSTLMKIIYGAVRPDAGTIVWDGREVDIRSPHEARALGIAMVFQHFSLFDTLSVAENVWLGLDRSMSLAAVARRIHEVAQTYGLPIDPHRPVHSLSVGERQRVEVVRALLANPRLLILDEPTSVLTPQAVQALFVTLRQLADKGCSILYISHKLDEIRALCHRCTVMRGGAVTGEVDPRQETNASLARRMIGAEPPPLRGAATALGATASPTPPTEPGAAVLAVRSLDLPRQGAHGVDLDDVAFELRAGEVLGIAGVSGNGQQALMAALSGEDRRAPAEAVRLFDRPIGRDGPRRRRAAGLHVVPEERLGHGAVPSLSLAQNTLLTRTEAVSRAGWIRVGRSVALAQRLVDRYQVRTGGPQAPARSLSGGNLQKFIVGREIDAGPRVLIVSQPTWGVDVGAAAQIRAALLALRDAGCAVLVVSEDLDELFEVSDRLAVMARGRLSPSLPVATATRERIGQWMSGLWDDAPVSAIHPGTEAAHAAT